MKKEMTIPERKCYTCKNYKNFVHQGNLQEVCLENNFYLSFKKYDRKKMCDSHSKVDLKNLMYYGRYEVVRKDIKPIWKTRV